MCVLGTLLACPTDMLATLIGECVHIASASTNAAAKTLPRKILLAVILMKIRSAMHIVQIETLQPYR